MKTKNIELTLVLDYANVVPIHFVYRQLLPILLIKGLHVRVALRIFANLQPIRLHVIPDSIVHIFVQDHFLALCQSKIICYSSIDKLLHYMIYTYKILSCICRLNNAFFLLTRVNHCVNNCSSVSSSISVTKVKVFFVK